MLSEWLNKTSSSGKYSKYCTYVRNEKGHLFLNLTPDLDRAYLNDSLLLKQLIHGISFTSGKRVTAWDASKNVKIKIPTEQFFNNPNQFTINTLAVQNDLLDFERNQTYLNALHDDTQATLLIPAIRVQSASAVILNEIQEREILAQTISQNLYIKFSQANNLGLLSPQARKTFENMMYNNEYRKELYRILFPDLNREPTKEELIYVLLELRSFINSLPHEELLSLGSYVYEAQDFLTHSLTPENIKILIHSSDSEEGRKLALPQDLLNTFK